MSFEPPDELYYLSSHEYADVNGGEATIGITEFAQDELGDVVYVELPEVGDRVRQGDLFGMIESIKAMSDLYSPVSGTVTGVNDALENHPERVNEDPYGDGWMITVEMDDTDEIQELLTAEEYREQR